MEQGLKLVLSADAGEFISEVQKAKASVSTIAKEMPTAGTAAKKLGDEVNKAGKQIQEIVKPAKDASDGIKKVGDVAKQSSSDLRNISTGTGAAAKSLGDVKNSGDRATNTLVNLSRVAQDAPYGFMGIANNLNPLLESFQRLQAESGSTKTALAAMAAGLTGPAGIGLALGIVSSLIVAFGDKLIVNEKQLDKNTAKLLEFAKAAEQSADRVENLEGRINQLNRLGKINLQIQFNDKNKVELFDLKGQSVQNREFIGNLEGEIEKLKAKSAEAFSLFQKQGSKKANNAYSNGFLDAIIDDLKEKDKKLIEGFRNIDKVIEEQEQKLAESRNNQTAIYREIALSKVEAARDAAKKAAKENRYDFLTDVLKFNPNKKLTPDQKATLLNTINSFSKEYGQLLEGADFRVSNKIGSDNDLINVAKVFDDKLKKGNIKLKQLKVPIDVSFVPDDTTSFANLDNIRNFLEGEKGKKPIKIDVPFDFNTAEQRAKILVNYQQLFSQLGSQLPKTIKLEGLSLDVNDISIPVDTLRTKLQAALQVVQAQVQSVASMIDSTLTPAIQSFFTAVTSGESPLKAFFQSIQQSIVQLISQLIAAQIKALVLKAITGAATGGGGLIMGGFSRTALSGLPSIGGGIAAPTGLGGGGVIDLFSRMNNLAFAGSKAQNITVNGRLEAQGGALVAVLSSEQRNQRNFF